MPLREFAPCWNRIARAESHIAAFAKAWSDFLEDEPYNASLSIAADGSGALWVVSRYDNLPSIFGLELGEVLYNLRAALDGAIYAAAVRETRSDPPLAARSLEFPVCSSADYFRQAERKVAPLTGQRRLIIESIQPYNEPPDLEPSLLVFNFNRTLSILNDWARKDRHRTLHVVGAWSSRAAPMIIVPAPAYLKSFELAGDGFINGERKVASFEISGYISGMNVRANPNLLIDAAVDDEPLPVADNDTLENRIRAMTMMAKTVVGGMEESLL
jgi:hypothetical protein